MLFKRKIAFFTGKIVFLFARFSCESRNKGRENRVKIHDFLCDSHEKKLVYGDIHNEISGIIKKSGNILWYV